MSPRNFLPSESSNFRMAEDLDPFELLVGDVALVVLVAGDPDLDRVVGRVDVDDLGVDGK
jgi:hypothetical protein